MIRLFASFVLSWVLAATAAAQAPQQREHRSVAPSPPAQRESSFFIKGANAPFKNQQRKLTDPLNANGGR